jgi:hypothetical protein
MKTLRLFLALLALLACGFALQQHAPIPPFEGDGNSQHDGQPAFCINTDTREHLHNCSCKGMLAEHNCEENGGGESSRCAVYCRKNACQCKTDCRTEPR